MPHPDVPVEQAHVDRAYRRLEELRQAARSRLQEAFEERGGTFQAVTERDIRVRDSLARLGQLELGRESLVFGRIDRASQAGSGTEAFHIGRLAISDADQEPLVVDWRAPVAEPFYRATGAHPMQLRRRRHFLTEGSKVLDLEDELFGDADGAGDGLGLSGGQALLAALERSRTGRMRDIVATIQREQDEVIRAPLGGVLVVQGGPGTGKTAVALHRAAYLLYTYRFPLERQGVLVVGPNPVFLRYISHVLPSLGENGVQLSTLNGLFRGAVAGGQEPEATARLKGDPRMARLIAKAIADRERPLRTAVEVPFGGTVLRVTPEISRRAVSAAKRRQGTHNAKRRLVENVVFSELLAQLETRRPLPDGRGALRRPGSPGKPDASVGPGASEQAPGDQLTAGELRRRLRKDAAMSEALQRIWPVLSPQELLHDLFGAKPLIDLAAKGILEREEAALLARPRSSSPDDVAWTDADIALLDEADALLGPLAGGRHAAEGDWVRSYGHVVVDEAQDLSPMKLRMLARRSLSGSMTIVGDLAQATGPWAPRSWDEVVEHLPSRRGWRVVELSVNYRTPAEVMKLASEVLRSAAPGLAVPVSIRSTGSAPRCTAVPAASLPAAVVEEVRSQPEQGTVGVITSRSLLEVLSEGLAAAGLEHGRADRKALDVPVSLLAVEEAKGLEFDTVLVVEPARIVAEAPQGLRALYVALSRATRDLVVVHSEPLPAVLGRGAPGEDHGCRSGDAPAPAQL